MRGVGSMQSEITNSRVFSAHGLSWKQLEEKSHWKYRDTWTSSRVSTHSRSSPEETTETVWKNSRSQTFLSYHLLRRASSECIQSSNRVAIRLLVVWGKGMADPSEQDQRQDTESVAARRQPWVQPLMLARGGPASFAFVNSHQLPICCVRLPSCQARVHISGRRIAPWSGMQHTEQSERYNARGAKEHVRAFAEMIDENSTLDPVLTGAGQRMQNNSGKRCHCRRVLIMLGFREL